MRSVWAAVGSYNNAVRDPNATRLPFYWTFIGPAPYLAGLSCSEARRLLKQSYVKPIRGPCGALATRAEHNGRLLWRIFWRRVRAEQLRHGRRGEVQACRSNVVSIW